MRLAITGATAGHAAKIQQDHAADKDGWCGFCLRHFDVQIPAGWCKPHQLAQGFINALARQQERRRPPVPRMEFSRPGGRVWPAET